MMMALCCQEWEGLWRLHLMTPWTLYEFILGNLMEGMGGREGAREGEHCPS